MTRYDMSLQFKETAFVVLPPSPRVDRIVYGNMILFDEREKDNKSIVSKKKRLASKDNAVKLEVKNNPTSGFKIIGITTGSHFMWGIIDPRGYCIEITTKNMDLIVKNSDITSMEIQSECVWASSNNSPFLVPVTTEEYKKARKATQIARSSASKNDVKPGNTIILKNGSTGTYYGQLNFLVAERDGNLYKNPECNWLNKKRIASPEEVREGIKSIASLVSLEKKSHVWVESNGNIHITKTFPRVSSIKDDSQLSEEECRDEVDGQLSKNNKNRIFNSKFYLKALTDNDVPNISFSFKKKYVSNMPTASKGYHGYGGLGRSLIWSSMPEKDYLGFLTCKNSEKMTILPIEEFKTDSIQGTVGTIDKISYMNNSKFDFQKHMETLNFKELRPEDLEAKYFKNPNISLDQITKMACKTHFLKNLYSKPDYKDYTGDFYCLCVTVNGVTTELRR